MKFPRKYLRIIILALIIIANFALVVPVHATSCPFSGGVDAVFSGGRITSFKIEARGGYDAGNNRVCPNGFGTQGQVGVTLNDIPVDIILWGQNALSVNVPSSIEGVVNIKVISKNGNTDTYIGAGDSQLLISLKVDSHPSEITLGDSIEITGNFANTPGSENINSNWAGRVVNLSAGGFNSRLQLTIWTENKIIFQSLNNSNNYKIGQNIFKVYYGSTHPSNGYQSQEFIINISSPICAEDAWNCGDWSYCSVSGNQTRACTKQYTCEGGTSMPTTSQSCTPSCTADDWSCSDWLVCSQSDTQTRTCGKTTNCQGGVSSPVISQSCTYIPVCISFYYSSWSECEIDGTQTRNIISKYPYNCVGGEFPKIDQSCIYTPACTADTWLCGDWGSCSLAGIQNRSCTKTFDCPNVQTAPPITDQYCEPPDRPTPQIPPSGSDEILNQESIIKSTVKLLCPVDAQRASQGSGTIIDPNGTILTNKHVVAGTLGCFVGFINDFNDEPYFGERQIADVFKISSNQDIAILKIRNPQNKKLTSIDITKGNSNLRLGTKITIYGYPAKFGTKVTYTSGDFSGADGNYLKTTAILEYGNSGGGAYLKNGTFIGIPSAVVKGELNALGYILSINTINSWLGNSSITYGGTSNNTYSRVSVLEDMDLSKLDSLKLFIPETDAKGDLSASATNQNTQNVKGQPQPIQVQEESIVIEPIEQNQQTNEINQEKNGTSLQMAEQRRSKVANAVQEILQVAEGDIKIGEQVKIIAQTQIRNHEELETGMQKIQSRSGFVKFFIGPDYGEIKNSKKLLERNKEQIKQLDQVKNELTDQNDQEKLTEQIQILERTNQEIENSLDTSQKGFSLFGWLFRLFTK